MLLKVEIELNYRFYIYAFLFAIGLAVSLYFFIRNRRSVKRMDRFIDHLMDNPEDIPVLAGTLDEPVRVLEFSSAKNMESLIILLQSNRISNISGERYSTSWIRKIDDSRLLFFVKYGRLNKLTDSEHIPVTVERYEFEPLLLYFNTFEKQKITVKGAASASSFIKSLRGDFVLTLEQELRK